MASTFFGLHIGSSALSSFQVATNTTANNIANVKTTGYTRQEATLQAKDAINVTARYGSVGTGVTVTSIKQQRDLYYDNKYWENNSCYGRYEQKLYYMEQIQNYFKDNGSSVKGFSSVFSQMFSDLDTLRSKPSDKTVRNQFISSAQSLCTYFNQMSDNLSKLQDDCNEEIRNNVDKINSISEKISLLNKEINQIETGTGVEASSLRDERANLIDSLSKIVNVSYNETEVQNTNGDNLGGTEIEQERKWLQPGIWIGPAILSAVLLVVIVYAILGINDQGIDGAAINAKEVGIALFGPYVLAVELASMLLLAGLVVAFHIGREERAGEVLSNRLNDSDKRKTEEHA